MSLNLASLQQKADQVIHNADEAIRKWQEFITAPAGTVSLEYYDKNGNLQQVSFDNRNKLVQNFISNVNSAMFKIFYVDAVNGNDANDGSQANPFKTIEKAVYSVPVGGYAYIYLVGGQTYTIDSGVDINNKRVIIMGDSANKPTIKNAAYINNSNNYTGTYGFKIYNGQLSIKHCNIITADYVSGTSGLDIWEGFVKRADYTFGSFQLINCNITLGDTDLVRLPGGSSVLFVDIHSTNITRAGTNRNAYVVFNENGNFGLSAVGETIKDSANNSLTWNDVLSGIVRDSNGVPRNVISNMVL